MKKVEAKRAQKIFIDYSKSFNATFAELLVRYLRDEAPRQKSKDLLAYKRHSPLPAKEARAKFR